MKITVIVDDEIVRRVHEIAADKNTTLTAMVRDYLTSVANSEPPELDAAPDEGAAERVRAYIASIVNRAGAQDQTEGEDSVNKLKESWNQLSRPMGPRNWTRDDLYDRPKAFFKRD